MMIHRFLCVLLASLLSISGAAAQTAQLPPPLDTTVPHAILMDARTGLIFYEKSADELIPPASMSKLMTALMVFDALKDGRITMDTEFLISEDAWRRGGAPGG